MYPTLVVLQRATSGCVARIYKQVRVCSATEDAVPHEAKENLLTKVTKGLGSCQVRSGTDDPCRRPAVVTVQDIPFCKRCAREQEAYFAIGELTEIPRHPEDESLAWILDRVQRTTRQRRVVSDHELLVRQT